VAGVFQFKRTWYETEVALQRDSLLALDTMDLLIRSIRLAVTTVANRVDADDLAGSAAAIWPTLGQDFVDLRTLLVLDTSGIIVGDRRVDAAGIGTDVSDRPYFQEIANGSAATYFLGDSIISRIDGNWVLPLSTAILDEQNSFSGVVVASAGRSYFDPADWQAIGPETEVFLISKPSLSVVRLNAPTIASAADEIIEQALQVEIADSLMSGGTKKLELQELLAFQASGRSAQFDVVVGKRVSVISADAWRAGGLMGGLSGLVALALALIGLQAKTTISKIRADADQLQSLKERHRLATVSAEIGVWDLDLVNDRLEWDPTMFRLYGTPEEEFTHSYEDWRSRIHPDDVHAAEVRFRASLKDKIEYADQFRIVKFGGEQRVIKTLAGIQFDDDGVPVRVIGVNYDVTDQVEREEQLQQSQSELLNAKEEMQHQAKHDPLTGLANRRGVDEYLEELKHTCPATMPISFLHIDLDRFKAVNDLFGHAGGDHLLRTVSGVLSSVVEGKGYVARLGGDEFSIIICDPEAEVLAADYSNQILQACRVPTTFRKQPIHFSTSVGVCTGTLETASRLFEDSDIALYEAKKMGRNQMHVFSPALRTDAEEKKQRSDALLLAVNSKQIGIRLQPQVCSATGSLRGAEALVRWLHDDLGELAPVHFLSLATELGVMHQLDALVLEKAIEAARQLTDAGVVLPKLSVNVSLQRLMQPSLFDDLDGLPELPCPISFELIETIDLDTVSEAIIDRINVLHTRGIEIEIDDFGSGHASISMLLRLRPDRIKIDKRLVLNEERSDGAPKPILKAIVEMCSGLGIPMTAEGIETAQSARQLTALGCDILQGYYYAKPLKINEFEAWFKEKYNDVGRVTVETSVS